VDAAVYEEKVRELAKRWDDFYHIPFPASSPDDKANALHSAMALYDTFSAGVVHQVVMGNKPVPEKYLAYLAPDVELEEEARRIVDGGGPGAEEARAYLGYLLRFREVLEMASDVDAMRRARGL
jgi:hypothetical protein